MSEGYAVFITGAANGIGRELALHYARHGAHLGLLDRDAEVLEWAKKEALEQGASSSRAFAADVRDRAAVREAVQAFARENERLDLFIANAGIDADVPIEEYDGERAGDLYEINFVGAINGLAAALEVMQTQGFGRLAPVVSLAAWRLTPIHTDYAVSKMALDVYIDSLRMRLRRQRSTIAISAIYPGFVRTAMTANHTHPMPMRMEAAQAAERIARGLDKGKRVIAFPWLLALGMRVVRRLPGPVWRVVLRFIG